MLQEATLKHQSEAINNILVKLDSAVTLDNDKIRPLGLHFNYSLQSQIIDSLVNRPTESFSTTENNPLLLKAKLLALKEYRQYRHIDRKKQWERTESLLLSLQDQSYKIARKESLRKTSDGMFLRRQGWAFMRKLFIRSRLTADAKKITKWFNNKSIRYMFHIWANKTKINSRQNIKSYQCYMFRCWCHFRMKMNEQRYHRMQIQKAQSYCSQRLKRIDVYNAFKQWHETVRINRYEHVLSFMHYYRSIAKKFMYRLRKSVQLKHSSLITANLGYIRRLKNAFDIIKGFYHQGHDRRIHRIQIDNYRIHRNMKCALWAWIRNTPPVAKMQHVRIIRIAMKRTRIRHLRHCINMLSDSICTRRMNDWCVIYHLRNVLGNTIRHLLRKTAITKKLFGSFQAMKWLYCDIEFKAKQRLLHRTVITIQEHVQNALYFKNREQQVRLNLCKVRCQEFRQALRRLHVWASKRKNRLSYYSKYGDKKSLLRSWTKIWSYLRLKSELKQNSNDRFLFATQQKVKRAWDVLSVNSMRKKASRSFFINWRKRVNQNVLNKLKKITSFLLLKKLRMARKHANTQVNSEYMSRMIKSTHRLRAMRCKQKSLLYQFMQLRLKRCLNKHWIPFVETRMVFHRNMKYSKLNWLRICFKRFSKKLKIQKSIICESSKRRLVLAQKHYRSFHLHKLIAVWKNKVIAIVNRRSILSSQVSKNILIKKRFLRWVHNTKRQAYVQYYHGQSLLMKGHRFYRRCHLVSFLNKWLAWHEIVHKSRHSTKRAMKLRMNRYLQMWRQFAKRNRRIHSSQSVLKPVRKPHQLRTTMNLQIDKRLAGIQFQKAMNRFMQICHQRTIELHATKKASRSFKVIAMKRFRMVWSQKRIQKYEIAKKHHNRHSASIVLECMLERCQQSNELFTILCNALKRMNLTKKHRYFSHWQQHKHIVLESKLFEDVVAGKHWRLYKIRNSFQWWSTLCTNAHFMRSQRKHPRIENSEARSRGFFRRWLKFHNLCHENKVETSIIDAWRRKHLIHIGFHGLNKSIVEHQHHAFLVSCVMKKLRILWCRRTFALLE